MLGQFEVEANETLEYERWANFVLNVVQERSAQKSETVQSKSNILEFVAVVIWLRLEPA